jgi:hypothetical protein
MDLFFGLLALGLVGFQWLMQEVMIKIGPWRVGFHRDDHPGVYWSVMLLELGFGALLIYSFFK